MSEISLKLNYFCSKRRCRDVLEVDSEWLIDDDDDGDNDDGKDKTTESEVLTFEIGSSHDSATAASLGDGALFANSRNALMLT
jgi:hypothetical protein